MTMGSELVRASFLDKTGCPFEVGGCGVDDSPPLRNMYDCFHPRKISQGLPPEDPEACRRWVDFLLEQGVNFLAWMDGRVVGHSALVPDFARRDAEYLIFVLERYRGRGLGTELTRLALQRAAGLTLDVVWLTVEGYNFRAIRLYRKFGFQFADEGDWERTMVLRM